MPKTRPPYAPEFRQLQVDPPPPHCTIHRPIRTRLDDPVELGPLLRARQARARRLGAVQQTGDTPGIVPVHPVAQRLALQAGSLGRIAATSTIQNKCDIGFSTLAIDPALRQRETSFRNSTFTTA